jgi:hypothetical protein
MRGVPLGEPVACDWVSVFTQVPERRLADIPGNTEACGSVANPIRAGVLRETGTLTIKVISVIADNVLAATAGMDRDHRTYAPRSFAGFGKGWDTLPDGDVMHGRQMLASHRC